MTDEQKAVIAEIKGDPEFIELLKDVVPEPEALKSALQKERDARKALEKEKNELQKAAEIEAKKALEEQGKYRELYEKSTVELQGLKGLEEYKTKYEQLVENRKKEILERIPGDRRDAYKEFELSVLETVVKDFEKKEPFTSPGSEPAGRGLITADSDWDVLSEDQRTLLWQQNPSLANVLMQKSFVKNRK